MFQRQKICSPLWMDAVMAVSFPVPTYDHDYLFGLFLFNASAFNSNKNEPQKGKPNKQNTKKNFNNIFRKEKEMAAFLIQESER